MTDRFHSLLVVLEKDMREDDVEAIIFAIRLMKGVISVGGEMTDPASYTTEERAHHHLGQKILNVIYPNLDSSESG